MSTAIPQDLATAPGMTWAEARKRGVYYTPLSAARVMVQWALGSQAKSLLEPSMGDGVFLAALSDIERNRRGAKLQVAGVEHSPTALNRSVQAGLIQQEDAICSDFMAVSPFEVDSVVGNPPYVRLRNLPKNEAVQAREVSKRLLGEEMDPSGSLWMPFVLHATDFLTPGGRLAFVLPYDLTYVRYARPLWDFLGRNFGSLRVVRVRERMFPDILQETVILFAGDKGGVTQDVTFEAFEDTAAFELERPTVACRLDLRRVVDGERAFASAILPEAVRFLLSDLESQMPRISDLASVHIGYVSGDKSFFHPTSDLVDEFSLSESSLVPALTSSRQLSAAGLFTSGCSSQQLFLPPSSVDEMSSGERRYLRHGEQEGVPDRYKCRVRDPWFVVPGVQVPDVVFPVFTEHPLMLINDAQVVASNSLLCGYLREGVHTEALARSWYTSLTRLQLELNVHSLGGGVFVLVPNEVNAMRVAPLSRNRRQFERVARALAKRDLESATEISDIGCLAPALGIGPQEIEMIREGCETLAAWRKSAQASG